MTRRQLKICADIFALVAESQGHGVHVETMATAICMIHGAEEIEFVACMAFLMSQKYLHIADSIILLLPRGIARADQIEAKLADLCGGGQA